jgi:uncharacterized protein (DUF111 family)
LLAEFVEALGHLTEPVEIEEVGSGAGSRDCPRVGRAVAERHGGVAAIGQTHDDVRVLTVADADDGQALSAQRVMRVRDGHASRRELGRGGSVLVTCRP